jgi:arylsulfatase A-like enzyme
VRPSEVSKTGEFDILRWGLHLLEPAAPATTDSALAVLERFGDRPSFLWVHYYDSHQWFDLELEDLPASAGDRERYDRVLQIIDDEVGRLLAEIERRGKLEETAILLIGDHGEALGEHGIRFHAAYVWEAIMRVPLILVAPGVEPGTVHGPVTLLHLAPTIIDLLGGSWQPDDAASVLPLLEAEPTEMPPVFLTDTEQIAVVGGDWKLIFDRRERMFQLFDLSEDPGEIRNLVGFEREKFQELRALLALHLEQGPPLFEF